MRIRRRLLAALLALGAVATGSLRAQDGATDADDGVPSIVDIEERKAADPAEMSVEELWQQGLYYIRTANADAARSHIEAILNRDVDPKTAYALSLRPPEAMTQLTRGSHLPGLDEPIAKLRKLIEKGYRARRADAERIKNAINMLDGGLESYNLGRSRLIESGEYAVPYMIQKLLAADVSDKMRARIVNVLPAIGKDAVRPLSAALQTEDEGLQEVLANALGRIQYPHAAPRLAELMNREGVLDKAAQTARNALLACAGKSALGKSTAELYYRYAEKYYDRAESLRPDSRSATGNVWRWREGLGLVHIAVPRAIFCDIYAKRMARLALEHDETFYAAVPLWLSAAFNAEANLPPGEVNPLQRAGQPPARFYALASSPEYLQQVVQRALEDHNTPVALSTLKALVRIIGADSIVDARPIVAALTYPDREVRFFAAVSLAEANPEHRFDGAQMVLPILAGALRQPGKQIVLLICADLEQRNLLKGHLRQKGYKVIEAAEADKAMAAAQEYGGADAAVIGARPSAEQVVKLLRSDARYVRLPMVVAHDVPSARKLAEDDPTVSVVPDEPEPDRLTTSIAQTIRASVGRPLSPDEAARWAVAAAEAIERLGRRGSGVYDLSLILPALRQALGGGPAEVRQAAARALGAIDAAPAQQAVARTGNDTDAPDPVRLSAYRALSESLRMYGNALTEGLIDGVRSVAQNADESQPMRQAAAEAFGAMGLESEDIVPFIRATHATD
ncbi:MAG: HEAT repeat domain-containing protein [Planctomycetota bacterium]